MRKPQKRLLTVVFALVASVIVLIGMPPAPAQAGGSACYGCSNSCPTGEDFCDNQGCSGQVVDCPFAGGTCIDENEKPWQCKPEV